MRERTATRLGLIGLFTIATATGVTSADLLNFDDGAFYVNTSAAIGPDSAFDAGDQSGDLSDNPFDALLSSSSSWGLFQASGMASQQTEWTGSSISTGGETSAEITGGPGSLGGLFWDVEAGSSSMFVFYSDVDVEYSLYGSVVGDTSNMTLLNYDTGDTLHTATDVSFSYSGTLFAGIHYQLISDASSVLESDPALTTDSFASFDVNFSVIPAPGAFGLLVIAGIARTGRRRATSKE